MKLYTYFRSSASYRVRIALNLKGLKVADVPVNLLKGEQKSADYGRINPQNMVPALETDSGELLTQSLAIIEYLEETQPSPALLPKDPAERARVRALALSIACEIAPLNNIGVLNYLTGTLGLPDEMKNEWYAHWISRGLGAFEKLLAGKHTGTFCHGDTPGLADCVLMPQLYNARRYECDLGAYPTITRVEAACARHPAFIAAHPDNQPDKP